MLGRYIRNSWFKKFFKTKRLIVTLLSFGIIGSLWLFASHALNPSVGLQSESGQLNGSVCAYADQTASGSSAIAFGGGCSLDALFRGDMQLVEDARFSVDQPNAFRDANGNPGHAETTTVYFQGKYLMFYRTFVRPDGSKQSNGVPAGIALATSTDGNSWVVYNSGKPVLANRASSLQMGSSCSPAPCELAVYAPSAIVDTDGSLKMVYETMDTGVNPPSAIPRHWIEAASSSDGINWSTIKDANNIPQKILIAQSAWEGFNTTTNQHVGNIGTPALTKEGSTYYVYYHGHHCCTGQTNRGQASGNSLTSLTRASANPTLKAGGGWQSYGPGKGDILKEGNYYYYIFESFKGATGSCVRTDTQVGWGLARSQDKINWDYAAANPIRSDRIRSSCGEDMPSWQVINGEAPMVITTNIDYPTASQAGVKRYKLVTAKSAFSGIDIVGMGMAKNDGGYWQVAKNGEVYAFGNATLYGSAASSGRTDIVGMAVRPQGDGYWLVAANGVVYAYSAAVHRGDMSGQALNAPIVGIEADPDGDGYWLVGADGGVFAFAATFHGSAGNLNLNQPIVGMTTTSDGGGYGLVGKDGGIFNYGNAQNKGSLPGLGISRTDIIGMSVRPDDQGYWLVSADGAVYSFNATFFGGTDGYAPYANMRITAIGRHATGTGGGNGYYLNAKDGGVIDFGDAIYYGHTKGPGWNQ